MGQNVFLTKVMNLTPTDLRRYRSHNFGLVRFFVGPVVTYHKMSAANLYLSVGQRYGAKCVFDVLCDLDLNVENFKVKS